MRFSFAQPEFNSGSKIRRAKTKENIFDSNVFFSFKLIQHFRVTKRRPDFRRTLENLKMFIDFFLYHRTARLKKDSNEILSSWTKRKTDIFLFASSAISLF